MKNLLLLLVFVATCMAGSAQKFSATFSIDLSDTVTYERVEWIDADNDGLLDLLIAAKNGAGEERYLFFRNDSMNGFVFSGYVDTDMTVAGFLLSDLDGDNQIDVVISGVRENQPGTFVLLNKGDFHFALEPVSAVAASVIRIADFNEDGLRELLLSGRDQGVSFMQILGASVSGWKTVYDSISVEASAIEVFNFDGDNDLDFFVNGTDENGATVSRAYYNQGGYYFTRRDLPSNVKGIAQRGDFNYDGMFDVVVVGEDETNADHIVTFLNSGGGFTIKDSTLLTTDTEIFVADLNSDGIIDVSSLGFLTGGDTLNIVTHGNGRDTLTHKQVMRQAFGDFDRDGDLDLAQLKERAGVYSLAILTNNTTAENAVPSPPAFVAAAVIFDRVFLSWDTPTDDHTPGLSLTYDVHIATAGKDIMSGEFNLINARRLLVTHGNNTTVPYVLMRNHEPGNFYFNIQAVDNAFHAGMGGICKGSGGPGTPCEVALETTGVEACRNEILMLETSSASEWYSFRDGFLGKTNLLAFTVLRPDTLFSVERKPGGCADIRVYTIGMPEIVVKQIQSTRYVCEDVSISLGVESTWASIEWTSSLEGVLSHDDSISFQVSRPDTITVRVGDGLGCEIQRSTIFQISKPVISASPDAYQVLKGESVRLHATGGLTYQWAPPLGLDDPASQDPVASPARTMQYVVSGTDSAGCVSTASVMVIVEQTAFIPNLFTPNNDGSNDVLKIYGLVSARDFSFTVFNREGKKVFDTHAPTEASHTGWNGMSGGVDQPAGLYYWHVQGAADDGSDLRLNGKNSGSIVLLR